MHLTVHERIRVVELYNRLENHLSFTKRSIIVSKLAEKDYKIKISDKSVRNNVKKWQSSCKYILN